MPAKKQVTKEDILNAALSILRESGMDAVNARSLAKRLNCSTQPIYCSFRGMDEVKAALSERVKAIYGEFLKAEIEKGDVPVHKAYGLGYIRFAQTEKELFKYLFMRERAQEPPMDETEGITSEVIHMIARQNALSYEDAYLFHLELWVFVHGFASMLATSYIDWQWADISAMLTDAYLGIKSRFPKKKE